MWVYLIDTSAWVEFLRRTGSAPHREVRRLLHTMPGETAVTEPVVMELLAGPADPAVVERLEHLVAGLPTLPVDPALDYRAAATAARALRRRGYGVRSIVDCLIASVAARTGAVLADCDRDFALLAECLPDLRLHV